MLPILSRPLQHLDALNIKTLFAEERLEHRSDKQPKVSWPSPVGCRVRLSNMTSHSSLFSSTKVAAPFAKRRLVRRRIATSVPDSYLLGKALSPS